MKRYLENSWVFGNQHTSNTPCVKVIGEMRKYAELNEWRQQIQKLWDTAKAAPWGKFIALDTYNIIKQRSEINNLRFYLEKEQMKIQKKEEGEKIREQKPVKQKPETTTNPNLVLHNYQ